jgi:hypothetical protein
MKKYINKLFILGSLLFLGTSCESDAELTTLKTVTFPSNLEATATNLVLTEANENDPLELFSWEAVRFPVGTPVTYSLQFDLITDITGPTAWQKAKIFAVGEDVLSKAFLGKELNKIALDLGLSPDLPGKLVVRVEASLDHKIYSQPITITVTPFLNVYVFGEIYMPGSYQGWDIETAAALTEIEKGIYQGYMTASAESGLGFKLNKERNWEQFYGAGATNADLVEKDDTDFVLPGEGSYLIKVNTNTLKWTATPYSWGIVGDATAGSWDNSTPMSYDHVTKTWKITANLISGNVKFRLNNTWTINYGHKNVTDGLVYLDDPGAYYIGEAGSYEITFKIQETDPATTGYPPTAIYTITKK